MPANRYELAHFLVSWYDCSPHHHLLLRINGQPARVWGHVSKHPHGCVDARFFLQPKIIHNDRNWNTDSFVTQRCRSRASDKKKERVQSVRRNASCELNRKPNTHNDLIDNPHSAHSRENGWHVQRQSRSWRSWRRCLANGRKLTHSHLNGTCVWGFRLSGTSTYLEARALERVSLVGIFDCSRPRWSRFGLGLCFLWAAPNTLFDRLSGSWLFKSVSSEIACLPKPPCLALSENGEDRSTVSVNARWGTAPFFETNPILQLQQLSTELSNNESI